MMFPGIVDNQVYVPRRTEGPKRIIGDGMVPLSASETVDELKMDFTVTRGRSISKGA